jgi:hypothetical protein
MLNHNESTHQRGRDETFADEKAYTGVLAALGVMATVGVGYTTIPSQDSVIHAC